MTELQLQRAILELLQMSGWWATHIPAGSPDRKWRRRMAAAGYVAGTPDVVAVKDGRTLWVEVKLPGRSLTPAQVLVHRDLDDQGAEVILARSIDDILLHLDLGAPPWPP